MVLTNYVSNDVALQTEFSNLLKKYTEILQKLLEYPSVFKMISAIKMSVCFPTKIYQKEQNHILRVLKQNSNRLNIRDCIQILTNLRIDQVNENFEVYEELISEIIKLLTSLEEKASFKNLLDIFKLVLKMKANQTIEEYSRRLLEVFHFFFYIKKKKIS